MKTAAAYALRVLACALAMLTVVVHAMAFDSSALQNASVLPDKIKALADLDDASSAAIKNVLQEVKNSSASRQLIIEENRKRLNELQGTATQVGKLAEMAKNPDARQAYLKLKRQLEGKVATDKARFDRDIKLESELASRLESASAQMRAAEREAANIKDATEKAKFLKRKSKETASSLKLTELADTLYESQKRNAGYETSAVLQLFGASDAGDGIGFDIIDAKKCDITEQYTQYTSQSPVYGLDLDLIQFIVSGKKGENGPLKLVCQKGMSPKDNRISYNSTKHELDVRYNILKPGENTGFIQDTHDLSRIAPDDMMELFQDEKPLNSSAK
jgi:hypothetical protein